MYPREIIFGMTLYDILMGVGVIAAMLIFRYFSDREKFDAKYHNFVLGVAVVTVIGAYFGAVVPYLSQYLLTYQLPCHSQL